MRKYVLLALIALNGLLVTTSCNELQQTKETSNSQQEGIREKKEVLAKNKAKVKMEIKGMVCAVGCAKFIENKVADLDGIILSQINFEEAAAVFEYDKTTLSPSEIQEFINSIHNGQYKAEIRSNETKQVEETESVESEESLGSVKVPANTFSLPQLFTSLFKQFR